MLGMDDTEYQNQLFDLQSGPTLNADAPPPPQQPGMFSGAGPTLAGQGFGLGFAQTANALETAMEPIRESLPAGAQQMLFGASGDDLKDKEMLQKNSIQGLVSDLRPDPEVTGFAGQTLSGLQSVLAQGVAGEVAGGPVGAAAVMGGSQGIDAYDQALAQGVDKKTAAGLGLVSGITNAATPFVPFSLGGRLLVRGATGAAINTAIDQAGRRGTAAYLDDRGYPEMANQYRNLDKQGLIADVVLGSFFGALHGKSGTAEIPAKSGIDDGILPSDVDAAIAVKSAQQYRDAAPGVPVDSAAMASHDAAMQTAAQQVINGDPVDVAGIMKGDFIPRPPDKDFIDTFHEALRENGYGDVLKDIRDQQAAGASRGLVMDPDDLRYPVEPEAQGIVASPEVPRTEPETTGPNLFRDTDASTEVSGDQEIPTRALSDGERGLPLAATSKGSTDLSGDQLPERQTSAANLPDGPFTFRTTSPSSKEGPGKSLDFSSMSKVYHTLTDIQEIKHVTAQTIGPLKEFLNAVASRTGAKLTGVRAKDMAGIERKLGRRPPEQISDYVGGRLAVDSRAQADEIMRELTGNSQVSHVDDFFSDQGRSNGYRGIHAQILGKDGLSAEVQIQPREVSEIFEKAHDHYKEAQAAIDRGDLETADREMAENSRLLNDAWDRFQVRESAEEEAAKQAEVIKNMPEGDPTRQILANDPRLEIPTDSGEPVRAVDALYSADQDVAMADQAGKLMDAAASCAGQFI